VVFTSDMIRPVAILIGGKIDVSVAQQHPMLIDWCRSLYVDTASRVVGNVDGLSGNQRHTMVTSVVHGCGLYVLVPITSTGRLTVAT